jgi:4a-hydroxytetrahydrobiopterin dehydratase
MSRLLERDEIDRQLADIASWTYDGKSILRTYDFASFPIAVRWIDEMAAAAESMNHHPDVDLRWRRVHVTLSTHSEGGVTQHDVELAHQLESIAKELGSSE